MAVTIRGSQTYESGSGGYNASHTMTDLDVTGTDSCAIAAGFNRNPASDVGSWTFEGNTPTAIADAINANVVAVSTQRYLISNAATTIVSNTPTFKLQAMVGVALEGVDQTTPIAGSTTAGNYGTAATASYTGTSGNMLLVFVSSQNDRTFTASGTTDIASVTHADANLGSGYAGYVSATGSSQTIGATLSSADNWRLVIVEVTAAASGVTLTVNDLSTTPTLEAPALTQANTLAVQDTLTTPTLEAPALTQANTLIVQDASTTPTLENVAVTQANTLAVADVSTGTTLESPTLTQANTLAVADMSTTPTLEAVVVTTALTLTVADLSTSPTFDNVALTQANTLSVNNLSLTPTLEATTVLMPSTESPIVTPIGITEEQPLTVSVKAETEISLIAAQTTSSVAAVQEGTTITVQRKPETFI